MLIATNPATGVVSREYDAITDSDIEDRLTAVRAAFMDWRKRSFDERAEVLRALAVQLRSRKDQFALLMAEEMGKPVKEGAAEVEKAAWCAEHFADHAEAYLKEEVLESDASRSWVCYEPLGPILGILPWNVPIWLALRFMAPALMAGNTCIMKHDSHVPGCAAALEAVFGDVIRKLQLPDIMVSLPIETHRVEKIIADSRVAAVSFTGSTMGGAKVAAVAGAVVKRTVLELGGSDPFIVLADADLDKAVEAAVKSRTNNAGQSCIAAKRILVEAAVYDAFIEKALERLQALRLGDPRRLDTDIGPLARDDLRQNLQRQVQETRVAGARCLLGGELPAGPGYFYPVTLLADVPPGSTAFTEETFGPVMCVTRVESTEAAVQLANDTAYGLGAAVWTKDLTRARAIAMQIHTGQVAINGIVKTDPRLPSGGTKCSGYGRELGPHGIREFVNAKQIWMA